VCELMSLAQTRRLEIISCKDPWTSELVSTLLNKTDLKDISTSILLKVLK